MEGTEELYTEEDWKIKPVKMRAIPYFAFWKDFGKYGLTGKEKCDIFPKVLTEDSRYSSSQLISQNIAELRE